jgi:hypothetical protein
MAHMAGDQGTGGISHHRDLFRIEVMLFGILLKKTDRYGAMIQDFQVFPSDLFEERIVHAGKGHPLPKILS